MRGKLSAFCQWKGDLPYFCHCCLPCTVPTPLLVGIFIRYQKTSTIKRLMAFCCISEKTWLLEKSSVCMSGSWKVGTWDDVEMGQGKRQQRGLSLLSSQRQHWRSRSPQLHVELHHSEVCQHNCVGRNMLKIALICYCKIAGSNYLKEKLYN